MRDNVKLDLAIEIMAAKVAKVLTENSNQELVDKIMLEREQMYSGNMEVIEKIIKIYGPEVREGEGE